MTTTTVMTATVMTMTHLTLASLKRQTVESNDEILITNLIKLSFTNIPEYLLNKKTSIPQKKNFRKIPLQRNGDFIFKFLEDYLRLT